MINIALIGAGVIGRIHARNVSESAVCSLAHVADIDLGRADELCRSFGGRADESADRALADDSVDAVIIAGTDQSTGFPGIARNSVLPSVKSACDLQEWIASTIARQFSTG